MKVSDWIGIGVVGVGGYLLYKLLSKVPQVTAPITDAIASAWVAATSALNGSFQMQLLGNLAFPDGSLVPIAQLPAGAMRSDASGNLQVLYGGHIWQLQPHNANGDFPASLLA
ncbi:MAG: hypothetical protein ACRDLF_16245 [Solirubrobacteraceae bacterium]